MKKFSFRPTLAIGGRKFKGLRGFAGKPFHPPLTDIPIAAYLFAAAFDVISRLGKGHSWAHDFWRAATFVFIGGVVVGVLAALTGFWDWLKSSEPGTQARRTINTHAWIMIVVTVLTLVDIAWRLSMDASIANTPGRVAVLSVVVAALVSFGALFGGTLVYEYGFNVETAGDSPVWHKSETDVMPGQG